MTDTYAPLDHQIHGYRMIYVCVVLAFSAFSLGESDMISSNRDSLSRPVITRNHRQLKGFTFNTFHSESLVSCGLRCQRNPRCLSTNFRAGSSFSAAQTAKARAPLKIPPLASGSLKSFSMRYSLLKAFKRFQLENCHLQVKLYFTVSQKQ